MDKKFVFSLHFGNKEFKAKVIAKSLEEAKEKVIKALRIECTNVEPIDELKDIVNQDPVVNHLKDIFGMK